MILNLNCCSFSNVNMNEMKEIKICTEIDKLEKSNKINDDADFTNILRLYFQYNKLKHQEYKNNTFNFDFDLLRRIMIIYLKNKIEIEAGSDIVIDDEDSIEDEY